MDKKLIYGFLFATAMVGCTNEEFAEKQQTGDFDLNRPVIENFSFAVGQSGTRMEGDNQTSWFTGDDKIGGVLVDYANQEPYHVVDGHVGNNRFVYNPSNRKFETDGTTVVGSWLFYASYNERMTGNRNGVKFDFPAVQMYSGTGYQEIAKMDFKTSPIVNLAGQENGHFNYEIPMTSVYSYARITMKFDEPVIVQKLVIRPTDATAKNSVPFSTVYTIANTKVPQAKVYAPGVIGEQGVLDAACAAMRNRTDYETAKSNFINYLTSDDTNRDIIALNCLENTTESRDFDARMAIPAGMYNNLAVYAYTNKGVYKYDVNNAHVAAGEDYNNGAQEEFLLRRQYGVALHNVSGEAISGKDNEYLHMTKIVDYPTLAETTETNGTVVISQEDLVAVIKGINKAEDVKIRVLGNAVKINKDVMAALTEKEKELDADPKLQLIFKDDIEVVGNETATDPLVLHNITFEKNVTLASGYARSGRDIYSEQNLIVAPGAELNIDKSMPKSSGYSYEYMNVENNGKLVVSAQMPTEETVVSAILTNNGKLVVADNAELRVRSIINNGTIENRELIKVNNLKNDGQLTNNGVVNLQDKDGENNKEIVNNGTINVNSYFRNEGTITNNANAILLVKGSEAKLTTVGTIINYGDMYCHEGNNTINNTGKIYAKAGSTTYITTNSLVNEATTATNNLKDNKMGEIFCENRNEDVSVTVAEQKGYISYELPADKAELTAETGDKFNKVYLNGNCSLKHASVNYVVVNAESDVTLDMDKDYQEFTFNANALVYSNPEYKNKIAQLVVAEGVRVKIPTENAIGVYGFRTDTTWTFAQIINKGTILVGGDFWSQLARPAEGTFASGDGNDTAFHWIVENWK